ncbi:glycoside hydrolase [Lipomyces japonicus]|uniref:glycoside hydrolase n=1 Tax=Lipomyces japonicus TaxID=56871 RepID=UPI0034CDD719
MAKIADFSPLLFAIILFAVTACCADDFADDTIELDKIDDSVKALLQEHARSSNSSLKWGPYRPNLYFGVRPRGFPDSFLSGLIWYNVDDYSRVNQMRHSCEQGDDIKGFNWEIYDPRIGGRQVIHDSTHNVDITTEFVKDGPNWAVRVKGVPTGGPDTHTAIVFYYGVGGLSSSKRLNQYSTKGYDEDVVLKGYNANLGNFRIKITRGPDTNRGPDEDHVISFSRSPQNTHVTGLTVNPELLWRAQDFYVQNLDKQIKGVQEIYRNGNLPEAKHLFQISDNEQDGNLYFVQRNFKGAFEFDVLFQSEDEEFTVDKFTSLIEETVEEFDSRFAEILVPQEPFTTEKDLEFSKALLSNLLGGIGYFHGKSLVDRSEAAYDDEESEEFWVNRGAEAVEEAPSSELFTAIPSRAFFPRGFYWDEGFHLVPIIEWDPDLAIEIIKSWFNLINEDGWIAREQILGLEARSKVPGEFQTQYPTFANPPTLVFAIAQLVDKIENGLSETLQGIPLSELGQQSFFGLDRERDQIRNAHLKSPELASTALKELYPKLVKHFEWFRRTQSADIRGWYSSTSPRPASWKEGYRWRGRTPNHCLTSGLDDYPRAQPPHPAEMHVDLVAWIAEMANALSKIAKFVGAPDSEVLRYEKIIEDIKGNLDFLHWNDEAGAYCDLGWDVENDERKHECHVGYVSLIPFALGLTPTDKVGQIVNTIRDPEGLWSAYGIRSLSKKDAFFGQGENYWRGSVWININYMILKSLTEYYLNPQLPLRDKDLIADTYKNLRINLVTTVRREWDRTGFAWEQYEQGNGQAKGVKQFLGWTSLVTVIMSMPETLPQE